jgi:hypothetical protein
VEVGACDHRLQLQNEAVRGRKTRYVPSAGAHDDEAATKNSNKNRSVWYSNSNQRNHKETSKNKPLLP